MKHSNPSISANLLIPVKSGYHIVPCEEIMLLEADNNYCHIHLGDGSRYLVSKTLKYIPVGLGNAAFVRVHKSFLVNLRYVTGVQTGKKMNVQLVNGTDVQVARSQRGNLLNQLRNQHCANFIAI